MVSNEVNFDGIVGPSHNYSGLSFGNVASLKYQQQVSNPKQAALQGLAKMKYLADLGLKQAVLPPQERPHIPTLRALGFRGSDKNIIQQANEQSPELFTACCSASSMWAANAATVSPSEDSSDHRVHFTPANLCSKFHRSIEPPITSAILQSIFQDERHFAHHPPLLPGCYLTDEGAANHTRFCNKFGERGVQLFVFGRGAFLQTETSRFPARQSREASQAIARLHQLDPTRVIFAQQHPRAIDSGVFHNDVISVGNQNLFLYHESAFVHAGAVIQEIARKVKETSHVNMIFIPVSEDQLSLHDAVTSYFFNSQIVTLPDNTMRLIAPSECQEMESVHRLINDIIFDIHNPISGVTYFNLHESMRNGGGPACLRLRIVLSDKEIASTNPNVFLNDALYNKLVQWVERHYRDRLVPSELADISLLNECRTALDELTQILKLGSIYDFQR